MTVGPWKPISLETYKARITEVDVRVNIADDFYAKVDVNFELSSGDPVVASVSLLRPSGSLAIGRPKTPVQGQASLNFGFSKGAYDLWWPVGYGEQPLYAAEIIVTDEVGAWLSLLLNYGTDILVTSSKARCSTKGCRSLGSVVQ